MILLLDTHAVLWFLAGDARLSSRARAVIEDLGNRRLFSIASAWEIAIKVSLGKLNLISPFGQIVPGLLHANGIEILPLRPEHVAPLVTLPMHHRDPFDRILVTQAVAEGAAIVSADVILDDYGVQRIW